MFFDQYSPVRLLLLILLVMALAVTGGGRPSSAANDAQAADNSASLVIESADPEQEALISWAASRFEGADLQLPPLVVSFHASRDDCAGAAGLFFWGPPARVELCVIANPNTTGARTVVLHELGHAWVELVASQTIRDRFLDVRALDTWRDESIPVWRWGQEQAAQVLAWGLADRPVPVVTIYDADDEALAAAFEALVGREPQFSAVDLERSEQISDRETRVRAQPSQ